MIYKEYGRTGKKLSTVGFGGARFPSENGCYDYDKCGEIMLKAYELGINYFDTAPAYCGREGESIFGHAFKMMDGDFYVSTKSMAKDGSELRRQLETSLLRLNVPKIHFFHIWSVLTYDDYKSRMVKDGAYEAALRARDEGLIEHIAISTHCNGDEIEAIVRDGCFEGMTLGYNIFNFPYRQKGLKAAYEAGMGVAVMNPLGGGVIPQRPDYFDYVRSVPGETVAEAALRFVCSHKEVTTALSGMSSIKEVIANAGVGSKLVDIPDSRMEQLEGKLTGSLNELCSGCRYCDGCPNGVEVAKFMYAYNYSILGDPRDGEEWIRGHWWMKPDHAAQCIECGLCESKCTQHLPIMKRLKEIAGWQ